MYLVSDLRRKLLRKSKDLNLFSIPNYTQVCVSNIDIIG